MDLYEFSRRMPKAGLHVHPEGTISPATLLGLAPRNRVFLPPEDNARLQTEFKSEFIRFREA